MVEATDSPLLCCRCAGAALPLLCCPQALRKLLGPDWVVDMGLVELTNAFLKKGLVTNKDDKLLEECNKRPGYYVGK